MWPANLCRICGKVNDLCHAIYTNDLSGISIEEKIKKCLRLDVFKDDYKPKQICNYCLIKLNDFSDFIDTTFNTNIKLESIYNTTNWHERPPYDCLQPKQSVIVSNKQAISDELALDNLNVDCTSIDDEVLEFVGDFTCIQTNFQSHETVLRHPPELPHFESTLDHNLKNRPLISVETVRNSIQSPKPPEIRPKKSNSIYPCPHCPKKFMRRGTLNAHVAIHTNIRPYRCPECPKTFPVKSDLTTHRKSHSDRYKCKFCPKKFTVPSKLKRHLRTHTNERPYVCNVCGRAFSDNRNLVGHQATHSTACDFECTKCEKRFKTKHRLKQHSKSHQSIVATFKCTACSKAYKYKNNLVNHMKRHIEDGLDNDRTVKDDVARTIVS